MALESGECHSKIRRQRRVLVEGEMGAAPLALGIMIGMPTQPFRAGLTFGGRPSGPRWVWPPKQSFYPQPTI